MSQFRPTNDDVSMAEWLDGETQAHRTTPAARQAARSSDERVSVLAEQPEQTEPPVESEDEAFSKARQRGRYEGLNWGAGFFGCLAAAMLLVVMSGAVAAGVVALGITDQVLSTDTNSAPTIEAIATTATLFGVLLLAYFAGGYVAGRMSRFNGGKQGVAVWLIALLIGGIGVGFTLLAKSKYGVFDEVSLPTVPVPTQAAALSGVISAIVALFASLLAAVVGGKVGCRYHRKVDDAAFV